MRRWAFRLSAAGLAAPSWGLKTTSYLYISFIGALSVSAALHAAKTTPTHVKGPDMQAITVRDRDAGVGGLTLTDLPYPHAAENDVIVRVHAAGFTPGELEWPGHLDRPGRP